MGVECPDDDVLAAVSDGCASADQRALVEAHIDTCPECAALIADAVRLAVADREQEAGAGWEVGRYDVSVELGRGGMGRVFRAFDPRLQREVALKVIADGLGEDDEERLLREARALARLSHPNIVEVFDVGRRPEGGLFIAMELVRGGTLSRWLERKPGWRDVVSVFASAGAGLAAAHAAGVVHRDFKPGNVMIDDADGRVRVMDFGLARGIGDEAIGSEGDESIETFRGSSLVAPRGGRVTEVGMVVGTLPYLSPELLHGDDATPGSDQYAFCIALCEALAGRLPFTGNLGEQRRSKLAGGATLPTADDVPAWLRAVVARGLRPEPERRWPSMGALVQRLRTGASRSRRWMLGAGVAVIGGALALSLGAPPGTPACAESGLPELASDALGEALESAGVPAATVAALQRRLVEYRESWTDAHRDACGASEHKDLRMGCLSRARTEVQTVVQSLRQGDGPSQDATEAVRGLLDPASCADIDALTMSAPPPSDPVTAKIVEGARTTLARSDALERLGLYDEAARALDSAKPQIALAAYPPLVVEAEFRRGWLQEREGDYAGAAETLERVLLDARGAGHDEIAAKAVLRLAFVRCDRLDHEDGAMPEVRTADALVRALGDPPVLRAEYFRVLGAAHRKRGEYDSAARAFEAERDLVREHVGAESRLHAVALSNLGQAYTRLGRYADAKTTLEQSRDIFARVVGPDHMYLAFPLNALAVVADRLGEHEVAYQNMKRAVEVNEAGRGPEHPMVVAMLNNLGAMAYRAGHDDEARAYFQRVIDVHRERLPGHTNIAKAEGNLALMAFEAGEYEEAQRRWESTRSLLEASLGEDHPELLPTLSNLGDLYTRIGRSEDALALLTRALAIETTAKGEDHADLAGLHARLAQAHLARDDRDAARRYAELALVGSKDEGSRKRADEVLSALGSAAAAMPDQP